MSDTTARLTIPYVFHADLSDALPGFEYTLCAYTGEYPLTAHTAETRAAAGVGEGVTHFSAPVPIPIDGACNVHVDGVPADRSRPPYVHLAAIVCPPQIPPILDYVSTAQSLLFHHPDLITEIPDFCRIVMQHMGPDTAPRTYELIAELALEMKSQGPPKEEGEAWAQLVPFTDVDGKKHFLQLPSSKTIGAAVAAMGRVQVTTKNDLRLRNIKWTQEQGFSVVDGAPPAGAAGFRVAAERTTRLHGARADTKPPEKSGSPGRIRTRVRMENFVPRYLGAYIQFLDVKGDPLNTPDWTPDDGGGPPLDVIQRDNLRWLGGLSPTDLLFGVPNPALPGSFERDITFPEKAVAARLFALSLGTGRVLDEQAQFYGGFRTAIVNLSIPALLLPFGVAIKANDDLAKIFASDGVALALKAAGVVYAAYVGIGSAVDGKVNWSGLSTIGQTIFTSGFEPVAKFVGGLIKEGSIKRAIPFVGWAMAMIEVGISIAQITQTIVAVATSPWAIENRLTVTITSTVTVLPDPARGTFPAGRPGLSRSLNVRLVYQGNQPTMSVTIAVPPDSTALEFKVPLTNNLGGFVKFECDFFVGTEVAASASTGWTPNDGGNTTEVTVALFQKRVELTEQSEYEHAARLTFQNGEYRWMESSEPPTSTIASRDTSTGGNGISVWMGLSLSQRHHQLGYAWKAAGLGIPDCAGGTLDTQLFGLQSVDIPGRPMDDARFSGCGYSMLADIVYDPYPPRFKRNKDGQYEIVNGRPVPDPEDRDFGLYYLDPTFARRPSLEGGGYHLRKFPNNGRTPINWPEPTPSFARFPLPVDSMVIHPSGRVIAVNTELSELMIATLEERGRKDDALPFARRVAGPAIDYTPPGGVATLRRRPGLLANPIAVTSTYDGTVLVLEDITQSPAVSRLQAFDANGNPVEAFPDGRGKGTPFLELPTARRYLDITAAGNEELTDIYILYYEGVGRLPSDYHLAIYQIGQRIGLDDKPAPLVTTRGVPVAHLAVDLFRTLYTLNYNMTTDGRGNPAGPRDGKTGPAGRTVPELSQWLPKDAR